MTADKKNTRYLKARLLGLLNRDDVEKSLDEIGRLPPGKALNSLLTFFYHTDERVRWHAITAAGRMVEVLAAENLEAARVFMRRLMWNLNDESGGIGWGSPEAMGEIMARQSMLAKEFAHILVSYIRPEANFIEYEALQRGVLWGLGRLARVRPTLLDDVPLLLSPFLAATDVIVRGTAVWTAGSLDIRVTRERLIRLTDDPGSVRIYLDGCFVDTSVGLLAREAMDVRKPAEESP